MSFVQFPEPAGPGPNGHRHGPSPDDGWQAPSDADAPGATQRSEAKAISTRLTAAEIFAPLPPVAWLVADLKICPGRPNMFAGYGFSGKTIAAQSIALAVASGTRAWSRFETPLTGGLVRHIDYEQGQYATRKRYQRLAIGHDIDPQSLDGRLEVLPLPGFYFDDPGAYDVLARESEGCALVIVDSLRASAVHTDENDSRIRAVLDNMTRASEATGAAFLVIHHDGKPKEGHKDNRTTLRGSSGIFDACGCILGLIPGKDKTDPRVVITKKTPAEADGVAADDFGLAFVDVPYNGEPYAGLRVEHCELPSSDEKEASDDDAKADRARARIMDAVTKNHDLTSSSAISRKARGNKRDNLEAIRELVEDGLLVRVNGVFRAQPKAAQ